MSDPFSKLMGAFDRAAEGAARKSAQMIGRRSLLSSLGKMLVGGVALPMLPFDRSAHAQGVLMALLVGFREAPRPRPRRKRRTRIATTGAIARSTAFSARAAAAA